MAPAQRQARERFGKCVSPCDDASVASGDCALVALFDVIVLHAELATVLHLVHKNSKSNSNWMYSASQPPYTKDNGSRVVQDLAHCS